MMKQMKEYVDYTKRYYYDFNHVSHLVFFGSKFSGDSQKLILDQIYLSLENNGTEPTFALVADAIFDIGWIKEQMKSVFIDFINYGLWSDSPSAIDKFLVNKQQKFNQLKVKEQTLENYELGMVQSVKDWVEFHKEFKGLLVEKKEIWKVNFFELYKFNEIFYTAVTSSSKIQVKSFNKTRTYNVNGVEEETEEEKNINSLAPINPSYLRGKLVSEAQREALKAHGICYFCREQGHKRIDCSKWKLVEQKKVDDRSRNNNSLNTSLVQNYILKKDPNFFYSSSSLSESEINLIDNNTNTKTSLTLTSDGGKLSTLGSCDPLIDSDSDSTVITKCLVPGEELFKIPHLEVSLQQKIKSKKFSEQIKNFDTSNSPLLNHLSLTPFVPLPVLSLPVSSPQNFLQLDSEINLSKNLNPSTSSPLCSSYVFKCTDGMSETSIAKFSILQGEEFYQNPLNGGKLTKNESKIYVDQNLITNTANENSLLNLISPDQVNVPLINKTLIQSGLGVSYKSFNPATASVVDRPSNGNEGTASGYMICSAGEEFLNILQPESNYIPKKLKKIEVNTSTKSAKNFNFYSVLSDLDQEVEENKINNDNATNDLTFPIKKFQEDPKVLTKFKKSTNSSISKMITENWQLNPYIFSKIIDHFEVNPTIDLCADLKNCQVLKFYSEKENEVKNPCWLGVDSLSFSWNKDNEIFYANPP